MVTGEKGKGMEMEKDEVQDDKSLEHIPLVPLPSFPFLPNSMEDESGGSELSELSDHSCSSDYEKL